MKAILTLVLGVVLAYFCFAADLVPQKVVAVNKLYVFSEGGATFSPTETAYLVYRTAVKVFEADMYLECDLLTLLQQTNRPARSAAGGLTNFNAQADTIIAESNLMVMARGTTLLGERGVYTKSNETITVTGPLVVIERSNLLFFATNFVFNLVTSSGHAVGWTATEVELSGSGTNAPKTGFGPRLRPNPAPAQPRNDGPPK
jgi:lipopolysaccharide assembly outer membrane protein LptD (OstA)